jgi:hypothetical protein
LTDSANKDKELREWFKNLNAHVRKVRALLNYMHFPHERLSLFRFFSERASSSYRNTSGNQIRDSGRQLYDEKYMRHFDDLFWVLVQGYGRRIPPTNSSKIGLGSLRI